MSILINISITWAIYFKFCALASQFEPPNRLKEISIYVYLSYTTQVNSACGACWLASSLVIGQVIFTSKLRAVCETLKSIVPQLFTYTCHHLFFLCFFGFVFFFFLVLFLSLFFFLKVRQLYSGTDEASLAFLRVEVTGFMWVPYTEFRYGWLYRRKTCPISLFLLHSLVTRLTRIKEMRDTLIVRLLINGDVRARTHAKKNKQTNKQNERKNKQKKNVQKHWTNGVQ